MSLNKPDWHKGWKISVYFSHSLSGSQHIYCYRCVARFTGVLPPNQSSQAWWPCPQRLQTCDGGKFGSSHKESRSSLQPSYSHTILRVIINNSVPNFQISFCCGYFIKIGVNIARLMMPHVRRPTMPPCMQYCCFCYGTVTSSTAAVDITGIFEFIYCKVAEWWWMLIKFACIKNIWDLGCGVNGAWDRHCTGIACSGQRPVWRFITDP